MKKTEVTKERSALKEFFWPSKGSIWIFIILELVALISIYFSFRLVDPAAASDTFEVIQGTSYIVLFAIPVFLVKPFGESIIRGVILLVIQALYVYTLSSIAVKLYSKLRGKNK